MPKKRPSLDDIAKQRFVELVGSHIRGITLRGQWGEGYTAACKDILKALYNPALEEEPQAEDEGWTSTSEMSPPCDMRDASLGTPVLVRLYPETEESEPVVKRAYYGCRLTREPAFYLKGQVLKGVTDWQPLEKTSVEVDPVQQALDHAPVDDEPLTPEEEEQVNKAKAEIDRTTRSVTYPPEKTPALPEVECTTNECGWSGKWTETEAALCPHTKDHTDNCPNCGYDSLQKAPTPEEKTARVAEPNYNNLTPEQKANWDAWNRAWSKQMEPTPAQETSVEVDCSSLNFVQKIALVKKLLKDIGDDESVPLKDRALNLSGLVGFARGRVEWMSLDEEA